MPRALIGEREDAARARAEHPFAAQLLPGVRPDEVEEVLLDLLERLRLDAERELRLPGGHEAVVEAKVGVDDVVTPEPRRVAGRRRDLSLHEACFSQDAQ